MRMLVDRHWLPHYASVPWPWIPNQDQGDWVQSISALENWLTDHVGGHYSHWAWAEAQQPNWVGLAFRWQQDTTLFLLRWSSK